MRCSHCVCRRPTGGGVTDSPRTRRNRCRFATSRGDLHTLQLNVRTSAAECCRRSTRSRPRPPGVARQARKRRGRRLRGPADGAHRDERWTRAPSYQDMLRTIRTVLARQRADLAVAHRPDDLDRSSAAHGQGPALVAVVDVLPIMVGCLPCPNGSSSRGHSTS